PRAAAAQGGLGRSWLLLASSPDADVQRIAADAERALRRAVKLDPRDADAHFLLARVIYQFQGKAAGAQAALPELLTVTRLEPDNAEARYRLGLAYGDTQKTDLAYDAMKQATQLNARHPIYWRDLAQVARHYGRIPEARDDLERALRLAPADAVAQYWLGQVYRQSARPPRHLVRGEVPLPPPRPVCPHMGESPAK